MSVANLGEVVSTGSACRLQIEQGAKVNTTHPIVLVARALKVV
jgi:Fe-S oxidoreductase